MIEADIYAHLRTNITAVNNRIYPTVASPTADRPYIVYQRISGSRVHDKSGQTGLAHPRIQVAVWADTYGEAKTIARDVRKAMNAFPGGNVFVDGETDRYEEDTKIYGCTLDFIIWHTEEVT